MFYSALHLKWHILFAFNSALEFIPFDFFQNHNALICKMIKQKSNYECRYWAMRSQKFIEPLVQSKEIFYMTIYGKLYHGHTVQEIIEFCRWNLKSNQCLGEQIQIRLSQIHVHLLECLIQSSYGFGNSEPIRCQPPIYHIMHEIWVGR